MSVVVCERACRRAQLLNFWSEVMLWFSLVPAVWGFCPSPLPRQESLAYLLAFWFGHNTLLLLD